MDPVTIAAVSLGYNIYSDWKAGQERKKKEQAMWSQIEEATGEGGTIDQAIARAGELSGQKQDLYGIQYGNKVGQLQHETGQTLFEAYSQNQAATAQSGFAGSGALVSQKNRAVDTIQTTWEYDKQNIYDIYAEKGLTEDIRLEDTISGLEQERQDLEIQQAGLQRP